MIDKRINWLILIAMQTEAQPIIDALGLEEFTENFARFPFRAFASLPFKHSYKITLLTSRIDPVFKVDRVATQNAAVMASLGIYGLGMHHFGRPDVVLNAGTAGGFKKAESKIGDVYLIQDFVYHDRRIPILGFEQFGVGGYRLESIRDISPLPTAIGSTGNSLDITESELKTLSGLAETEPVVKDMEAAAITEVCAGADIPLLSLKSITDLVDGNRPTSEEFLANFQLASIRLREEVVKLLDNLTQESIKKVKWSRNEKLIEKILGHSHPEHIDR